MTSYINLKKLSEKNNEAEFRAEIPVETLKEYEKREIARMGRDVSLPGFRPGKVPEAILRERIDPAELLEGAAEAAIRPAVRDIAKAENIASIGLPAVGIKSIAPEKPVEFTVRFALDPEIQLPDYRKIAEEIFTRKEDVAVTDAEVDEAILEIRRMASPETKDEKDLPEMNDALSERTTGVKTVAELKDQIKRDLAFEKSSRIHDAKRDEVVKTIAQKAKFTPPPLLIEQELAHFFQERNAQLESLGITLEEYLKRINKNEKDLAKEERAMIENRVRVSLVFQKIKDIENISTEKREIEESVAYLKHRYPNGNPEDLRRSAEASIVQEKIFALLEKKPESA